MLKPDANVWRVVRADRMAVIVDADRYFGHARDAFLRAEKRILLVGWDFDARIILSSEGGGAHAAGDARHHRKGGDDEGPKQIGDFLYWLVERNPDLHLYLLRWDMGAVKSIFRGRTAFTILKWMRHPRITVRLDGHHPHGSSHHQKIVSIDDRLAFCGGIDMTGDRWDTRAHRDDEPGRVRPGGQPYKPWHDATTAVTGEAARALGELARHRWALAGGGELPAIDAPGDGWPTALPVDFRDAQVGIARTEPQMADRAPIWEVEQLFLDQIAAAKRWLYCESQYFASRRIAEAIAKRLEEPDGPEIVVVNPLSAQGWLEPIAMDSGRARLVEAIRRRDPHGRFRLYHPFTAGGEAIYVHAKITVVDDCSLRVGSANMNNRSLRLDTECDVVIDAALQDTPVEPRIAAIRDDLIAEHLHVAPEQVTAVLAETGSLIATIERLRGPGRSLRPYEVPDLPSVEKWLADNEVLDPENPDEMFEPLSGKGLWRGRLKRRF